MALRVKAVERLLKFDKNDPGSYFLPLCVETRALHQSRPEEGDP